jgi:hypothetical protein
MDNEMRPSISYIVTLSIDPWTEVSGPIVNSLTFRTGSSSTLPRKQLLVKESMDVEMVFIGGTVLKKAENGAGPVPMGGIQVAVKGTGLFTTSDEQGRFVLGGMIPGTYTLIGWLEDGKIIEKKIDVPITGGNYDLMI